MPKTRGRSFPTEHQQVSPPKKKERVVFRPNIFMVSRPPNLDPPSQLGAMFDFWGGSRLGLGFAGFNYGHGLEDVSGMFKAG